jgi:hypothetical protein
LLVGGGSFVDPADQTTQRFVFSQADFGGGEIALTATAFLPHGIAIDPLNPNRLVTFQKIGPGCCEIDLIARTVTRTIVPTEGRWFYGHGAFSSDGKLLYSTETVNSEERGVIGVRDAATFEYLGEFPTFGENPHDCHLIEGGKVLLVTNGGGALDSQRQPCVTWVEIDSRKLLDKREIGSERFNTGHLCLAGDGGLAVVSAPRKGLTDKDLGAVSLGRSHERLRTMQEPQPVTSRMIGEAFERCDPRAHADCGRHPPVWRYGHLLVDAHIRFPQEARPASRARRDAYAGRKQLSRELWADYGCSRDFPRHAGACARQRAHSILFIRLARLQLDAYDRSCLTVGRLAKMKL